MWRCGSDAAQMDVLQGEGVGGAEHGADITGTSDIIQYQHDRMLFLPLELGGLHTLQFV
jgi:hypothetical protein